MLLTLFRPATGTVRAQGVTRTPNAVVHPWLQEQLTAVLTTLPPVPDPAAPLRQWEHWGWGPETQARWGVEGPLPPIRMILIWDNLSGHKSKELVRWLVEHGVLPLYTPIGGSWLNLAESVQRIIVRRALSGEHPQSAQEVIEWLEAAVAGWNRAPTPFEWGGKRAAGGSEPASGVTGWEGPVGSHAVPSGGAAWSGLSPMPLLIATDPLAEFTPPHPLAGTQDAARGQAGSGRADGDGRSTGGRQRAGAGARVGVAVIEWRTSHPVDLHATP